MKFTRKDLEDLQCARERAADLSDVLYDLASPLGKVGFLTALYELKVALDKAIDEVTNDYWTWETDDGLFDAEFETKEDALIYLSEQFADICTYEGSPRDGATFTKIEVMVHFKYAEDGSKETIETVTETVEYTHYHGDREEHFRQSDYV